MKKHFGGLKDYRAAEGKEVLVPFRGSIGTTVHSILGASDQHAHMLEQDE